MPKFRNYTITFLTVTVLGLISPQSLIFASQYTSSGKATVLIGNAPSECPQGWPTTHGAISQGVQGATSHAALYPNEQAIDVAVPTGTPAYATFSGIVTVAQPFNDAHYGIHVDVQGSCNGTTFTARWAHLLNIDSNITVGSQISPNQELGLADCTGNCNGPHVHYSFFSLTMGTPYIPKSPSPTCDSITDCAISW